MFKNILFIFLKLLANIINNSLTHSTLTFSMQPTHAKAPENLFSHSTFVAKSFFTLFTSSLAYCRVESSGEKPSNEKVGSIHKHKYVTKYKNSAASTTRTRNSSSRGEMWNKIAIHFSSSSSSLRLDDDYYKFTVLRCLISLFHPSLTLSGAMCTYIQCSIMYAKMQKPRSAVSPAWKIWIIIEYLRLLTSNNCLLNST